MSLDERVVLDWLKKQEATYVKSFIQSPPTSLEATMQQNVRVGKVQFCQEVQQFIINLLNQEECDE